MIDEDVDWAIYGPIDMFPFFGARHGKAAVLEVIKQIADNVRVHRFDRESIHARCGFGSLDDALLAHRCLMSTSRSACGLRISRSSRRGRLISIRVLVDTFDLVEQALGRPIHLPRISPAT